MAAHIKQNQVPTSNGITCPHRPEYAACSVEENESLQELWAGLLATASQQTDAVPPLFVETLKQLSPDEARGLNKLYTSGQISTDNRTIPPKTFAEMPSGVSSETFERLGMIQKYYWVNMPDISVRLKEARTPEQALRAVAHLQPEIDYQFEFTGFAIGFLEACRGPQPICDAG